MNSFFDFVRQRTWIQSQHFVFTIIYFRVFLEHEVFNTTTEEYRAQVSLSLKGTHVLWVGWRVASDSTAFLNIERRNSTLVKRILPACLPVSFPMSKMSAFRIYELIFLSSWVHAALIYPFLILYIFVKFFQTMGVQ